MSSGSHSSDTGKVFISYKREEAALASLVRTKLAELGVDYFMDDGLRPDGHYGVKLDEQLSTAAVVLVLWTKSSAKSDFVYAEAQKGNRRDVLVAALFDGLSFDELRVPFNTYQASDLSAWRTQGTPARDPNWQVVLGAIGDKLQRPGLPELAIALEGPDEEPKLAFLRDYPHDPMLPKLEQELKARSEFRDNFKKVNRRVETWKKNVEKRLQSIHKDFESRIGRLRRDDEPFTQPNLAAALDHDAEALHERLQKFQQTSEDYQARVVQAENAATSATQCAAALEQAMADLHAQYQAAQSEAEAAAKRFGELHQQHEASQAEAGTLAGRYDGAARNVALRDRQIAELRADNEKLEENVPIITKRYGRMGLAAAACALLVGLGIGSFLLRGASSDIEQQAQLGAALKTELDRTKGELAKKQDELAGARSQLASAPQRDDVRTLQAQLENSQAETRKLRSDLAQSQVASSGQIASTRDTLTRQLGDSREEVRKARGELAQAQEANSALRTQLGSLQSSVAGLTGQLQQVQNTNSGLVAQVGQKQDEINRLKGTASANAVARCDDAASYTYDPDRPAGAKSKDRATDLNIGDAMTACQDAAKLASLDQRTKRRIKLQLGRVIATRGMLEITGDQRKASREQAGDLWKEAADLGSSQAHYLLGMFYATAGDYESSWRHFEASAKANNPTGLAAAANILLFSDSYNTYKKNLPYREDQAQVQGRQYLDDSLKTGSPRAAYVRGRAMLEGRGNFKAETGSGLAEIEFAFCKNDEEAEKFFARPPRRKGPDCSETRPQAFGR